MRPISVRGPCRRLSGGDRPLVHGTGRPIAKAAQREGARRGEERGFAILGPAQSAALRDQLLAEIATMTSADRVANWARAALPAKNTLTASDAKLVEDAFEQLLSQLPPFEHRRSHCAHER